MNINDIITGERIQSYAHQYFASLSKHKANPVLFNIPQQRRKMYNIQVLNKPFNNSKIVYIPTDFIKENYLRNLKNPCILIIHNSDVNLTPEKHNYLTKIPNLVKIYAQNCIIKNPKIQTIPIGIANSSYKHGNLKQLLDIINQKNKKINNFYFNFSLNTNRKKREICYNTLIKKGIQPIENRPYKEYLKYLSTFKYCICPEGNGADTHRFWECLYLGVIPITIKTNKLAIIFSDKYPVKIINSWDEFNKDELLNNYEPFDNLNHKYLKIDNILT